MVLASPLPRANKYRREKSKPHRRKRDQDEREAVIIADGREAIEEIRGQSYVWRLPKY